MARQVGENSPILNSIQVPQLTDIATGNYQNVIDKTLDNYSQAMKALEGKMTVDNTDWKTIRSKNEDYAAQVAAANRANAQSGSSGNDWGTALAGIGKSLVSGVIANEQLQAQKAQQEFENNLNTEKLNLTKKELEAKTASDNATAEREQLQSLVQARLAEIEGEAYKTIQNGSYEQGIAYAEAQVKLLMSDDLFGSMSDANKFYVASLGQTFLTRIRKENLTQVRGEQDKIEDSTIALAQTQWQYQSVSVLKGIENGAGVIDETTVEKGVKTLLESAQTLLSKDPALSAILTDKSKYIKFYNGILTQINGALSKYYGTSGQWSAETQRYSEAITKLSQLEGLMSIPGQMTEGEYQRAATLVLTGLGLSPDVSKIPTTQVNVANAARERQQAIEKYNSALQRSENLRQIAQNNPNVAKAKDYLIAREVFNVITNSNSSNLNTTISKLKYYIDNEPDLAQARGYQSQYDLLTRYRTEKEKVTTLQQNAHKLEGEIAALGFKINPPKAVQYVQPAGTALGTSQGVSPRAEVQILPVEQTIPGASTDELAAKKRELQSLYDQITDYATYWADNGINIFNPADDQYIKKLDASSKAARDLIESTPEYNQSSTSTAPAPTETGGVTPGESEPTKLYKALEFEVSRNGYSDLTQRILKGTSLDETTKKALFTGESLAQIDVLNTKYQNAVKYLLKAYDGGNTTDPVELINTLVYDKTNLTPEAIKGLDKIMKVQSDSLEKLNKLLQTKSQWYRQKFGVPQASNPPTNFSQGNAPKPASQTPLPQQTQPLKPAVPASGNLAKTPFGFAPFKSGKVTYTSDFQGRQRFGSSKRPDHNGIDLQNLEDKRVASPQGGTVVVADRGTINPDGYGNVVVVKTSDGTYELYGHLSTIDVKRGDVITPATVIGRTGTSGNATGDIVHFGVTTNLNTSNLTATNWLDPIDYLNKVGVKTTLPRGQGAAPNGETTTISNTGYYKISDNLVYMNGYIFDKTTGLIRKATQTEQANVSTFTPITRINRTSNNQPSGSTYQAPSGETVTETYRIPNQAVADKDFLFVHPTGRTASNGNPILAIEGYRNGRKVFAIEAVSGVGGVSTNRHQPGIRAMLPDGTYSVARNTVAGANALVGDKFLPLTYNGTTGRADIGIHWDADGDRTTSGCLATFSKEDRDKIYQFIQSSGKSLRLYVNTKDVQRSVARGSGTNTPTGNTGSSPVTQTSTQRSSYPSSNNPNASYGYQALKSNPEWAKALAEGANKIGVPAVWLADMIDTESSWINQRGSSDGKSAGIFQPTSDTLKWLGRATIGRAMTKAEFVAKGVAWQLSVALPKYLEIVSKEAGKGYKSAGDVVAAIWGGKRGLMMSPQERMTELKTRGETWSQKMRRVGRSVGRSYSPQASLPAIVHDNPRDTCATCNQMLLNGNFTAHTNRTDMLIPNDYA